MTDWVITIPYGIEVYSMGAGQSQIISVNKNWWATRRSSRCQCERAVVLAPYM